MALSVNGVSSYLVSAHMYNGSPSFIGGITLHVCYRIVFTGSFLCYIQYAVQIRTHQLVSFGHNDNYIAYTLT